MEQVAIFVAESALKAAYALLSAVGKARNKVEMFQPQLSELNSTLEALEPVLKRMEHSSDTPAPLTKVLDNIRKKMEEGVDLVGKCHKVRPGMLNFVKQHKCTTKILALNESLGRLLDQLLLFRALIPNDGNVVAQNQVGLWCAVPQLPPVTVGLDVPLEELKMKLLNDDTVSMLVLTAPGGCGKTTLAKMFCHDRQVKDKFQNNIFFAIVSNRPVYVVVQELCQHTGFEVPALQNEETAFRCLQPFMTEAAQNPLLLVLDDVQSESQSLLSKLDEFRMPNIKILVTSRYGFPRFNPYYLETLTDEDAMTLFLRSAYLPNRSFNMPEDLTKQIVEHCKRFPLAISVIGKSLCNRPIAIWRKRLSELSESPSILEYSDETGLLVKHLKTCLDDLNRVMGTSKDCFMDLGSFPEDDGIPVAALIDMWAELYEIAHDYLSIANLDELTTRNLSRLVVIRQEEKEVDAGYYGEHFVTQHDVLRLVAINHSGQLPIEERERLIIEMRGDNFPSWWTEQKHKPKKARLVSISTDEEFSAKWHKPHNYMHLPRTEVLVLNFRTEKYVLPKFMKKMCKLKVLIVTNYGFLTAELNNFELLSSVSELRRIRLEHIFIPSIIKNPLKLKALQKISFFMCRIGQAFSNFSIPMSKALPKLEEMSIDYCTDLVKLPVEFCDIVHLKKLSITNCHKLSALPDEIGKLVDLELLRLRFCTDLVKFPGTIKNLTKLVLLDIYNCFSIKELPEDIGEMSGLTKINMGQCSRLQELPESAFNLQQLQQVVCDEDTQELWAPILPTLPTLRVTVVQKEFNLKWLHKRYQL